MRIPQLFLSSFLLVAATTDTAVLAAAAAPAAQPALRTAEGSVVAVDAAAKSLTVRGRRADITFVWKVVPLTSLRPVSSIRYVAPVL